MRGSSGVQRTLRFAQHLPSFGWKPVVLTISSLAYESRGLSEGNEIPLDLEVHRAFGLDAARHFSLQGRYPRALALPDRWANWRFFAVRRAMKIIRTRGVSVVWSTFPIATAHRIGWEIATLAKLPWIAEFRDPMWQGEYPFDPKMNALWKRIEMRVFDRADRVVVTAPSTLDEYAERFPHFSRDRIALIHNGYDEETFQRAEAAIRLPTRPRPIMLLHSGTVYRSERDPTALFAAIARLKHSRELRAEEFQLVLRAATNERIFARDVASLGIDDMVKFQPPIDYLVALKEMLTSDGLLLLQAANCNAQIPGKLYEYLRAKRPIVALTDPNGDTARTLRDIGTGIIARLDSPEEIADALRRFVALVRSGVWTAPPKEILIGFSRREQAAQLARLLDAVTNDKE
ncbi:MAG: glycosyltransferase [Gammaproteobacteria bacterium]|nr:glycosyltransferase [Gammaproteobacteria bacterium]